MSAHGTISFWMAGRSVGDPLAKAKSAAASLIRTEPDNAPSGFRHFLGPPESSQQFTFGGQPFDPTDAHQRNNANLLMMKLADTIAHEPQPSDFNANIPSGYTYLLQFIAHDLVESSLFLSRSGDGVRGLSNIRTKPLRLETIFGGGPIACPHAYDTSSCGFRDRLRLGQVRPDAELFTGNTDDFRDIARARATDVLDVPGRQRFPEALIGDARNDSHAIISQLVVMFHHFQRRLLANIQANANIRPTDSEIVDAQRDFVAVQSACALIFRSIVRNDVLQKVLHPAVRAAYEANPTQTADAPQPLDSDPWRVPLEFSFGFYRFGHSMIRPVYAFNVLSADRKLRINDILCHTSSDSPDLMPFENKWTIDWRRFFGTGEETNFSVRIGPWSRLDIENAVRGPDNMEPGLMGRDLISSIAAQPWSIRALARELRNRSRGSLLDSSPYLAGDLDSAGNPPWFAPIHDWLKQRQDRCSLSDADIRDLSIDPPIPFFTRFEAGLDPAISGKHLGVLASIVIADVFYGIFRDDKLLDHRPPSDVDGNLDVASQLRLLSGRAFEGVTDAFAGVEHIDSMNALIDFLGELIEFPAGG